MSPAGLEVSAKTPGNIASRPTHCAPDYALGPATQLPKSTTYHWLNKELAFWKGFGEDIRRELSHRLQLEGWNKSAAGEKAWRMFEEAIYVSEDNRGRLDIWQLIAELEGLWVYAEGGLLRGTD
jgi:hypothetical protein